MKFLLVDDDEDVLALLAESLKILGFEDLTLLNSGKCAIQLIKGSSKSFDAFLLDIQMPEIEGIEVCQYIAERPQYRFTPIIMVTAMHDRSVVTRASAAGATDYITKPFDVFEIGSRVQKGVEVGRAKRRAEMGYAGPNRCHQ